MNIHFKFSHLIRILLLCSWQTLKEMHYVLFKHERCIKHLPVRASNIKVSCILTTFIHNEANVFC